MSDWHVPIRKRGWRVPPSSKQKIRNLSQLVRGLLTAVGAAREGWVDIVDVIEVQLPKLMPEFEYSYVEQDDPVLAGAEAITYPDRQQMLISASVYEGACNGNGRDRFTLAHELGHLILHKGVSSYARQTSEDRDHRVYEDSEWQADTFAAEFLMPYDEVRSFCCTVGDIKSRFGVSWSAAGHRLASIKKQS